MYRSPSLEGPDDIEDSPGNQPGNALQKSQDFTQNIFPISESVATDSSFVGKHIKEVLSDDLAIWIMHYVEQTLLTSELQLGEYIQRDKNLERWVSYEVRYVKSGPSEVSCNSTPGQGAEFAIELPLVQSTADPAGVAYPSNL